MPVADRAGSVDASQPSPALSLPAATRVVVIGAGQAGLSVAFHLRRLGLTPGGTLVVLDRGPGPGGAWQFRWESLRLGTAHRVNDLPGMNDLGVSFETADKTLAARDVVADYYDRYEKHFDLQVRRPITVRRVETSVGGPLEVNTDHGSIVADIVVNASGTWAAPIRPFSPGAETFRGQQITTPEYRAASDFAGLRVVVVGGGTSAVGFVLELEGVATSTLWVTRRPVHFGEPEGAGGAEGSGASVALEGRLAAVEMQDRAARDGRVLPSIVSGTGLPATKQNLAGVERGTLVARPIFTSIEPDGVRFADGSFEPADAIIWATGFRPELAHLAALNLRGSGGGVAAEKGRSTLNPRVFLAGYGPQASTIGANRAGRLVATQVLDALRHLDHPEPA